MSLAVNDEINLQSETITVFCEVLGGPTEPKRFRVQVEDAIIRSVRRQVFVNAVAFGGAFTETDTTWEDMSIDGGARLQVSEFNDIEHKWYPSGDEYYGQLRHLFRA